MSEIEFTKYIKRGADYHYKTIEEKRLKKMNSYFIARYEKNVQLIETTVNNLADGRNLRILDVGCGDALLLNMLARRLKDEKIDYYGVDVSEEALATAKQKNDDMNFDKITDYKFPYDNNFFDIIVSSDVVEHLKEPNLYLQEIKRVLKDSGQIIISTPVRYEEKPRDPLHVKEFFPGEFKKFISDYFSDVKLVQTHSLFWYFVYSKQLKILFKNRKLFRFLVNFSTKYLKKNPFFYEKNNNDEVFTYMYCLAKKDK